MFAFLILSDLSNVSVSPIHNDLIQFTILITNITTTQISQTRTLGRNDQVNLRWRINVHKHGGRTLMPRIIRRGNGNRMIRLSSAGIGVVEGALGTGFDGLIDAISPAYPAAKCITITIRHGIGKGDI